jgi:putative membrane protein
MNILIPYLHFIGIMLLMGSLFAEYVLLRPGINKNQLKLLSVADLIYWISAAIVLISGLLRWFIVDPKGADYFIHQPMFHIKLTVFVVIIILSIMPTLKFMKWKKQAGSDDAYVPGDKEIKKQLTFVRIEMLLIAIIPLLAVFVAQNARM